MQRDALFAMNNHNQTNNFAKKNIDTDCSVKKIVISEDQFDEITFRYRFQLFSTLFCIQQQYQKTSTYTDINTNKYRIVIVNCIFFKFSRFI